jgi:NADP-dependent aldehyde dehydrogenase
VAGGDASRWRGLPRRREGPSASGHEQLVGGVIAAAVKSLGLPGGTFSLLHGRLPATGGRLVSHPAIAAVGTGSHQGSRAVWSRRGAAAADPVFAEMG